MTRPLHLEISGMSCRHCVTALTTELQRVEGVAVKQVAIGTADLNYDDAKTSPSAIAKAVEDAGYAVSRQS